MIIFDVFQGLNSLNLFLEDFKKRGQKVLLIRIFLVFFYILVILMIPAMLFCDLVVFLVKLFEKQEEKNRKKEFIKMRKVKKK